MLFPVPMSANKRLPRRSFLLLGGAATLSGVAAYLGLPNKTWQRPARTGASPVKAVPNAMPASPAVEQAVVHRPSSLHESFLVNLHSDFQILQPDATSSSCKLVEVSPTREMRTQAGVFTCFTLTFEARSGFPSDGAICRVSHPGMEPMDLYLSPVGRAKEGKSQLEAAFTLRV